MIHTTQYEYGFIQNKRRDKDLLCLKKMNRMAWVKKNTALNWIELVDFF